MPAALTVPTGVNVWARIDLAALSDNVRALRRHAANSEFMAVVKADAYGHGLVPSAQAAVAGGAGWLGVALLPEALALRAAGIAPPVRILSWLHVPGADFAAALDADIDLAASQGWALTEIAAAARATGHTARVHLKVDTGLARNGAFHGMGEPPRAGEDGWRTLVQQARALEAEGVLEVVGIFSHFAYADAPDHPTVRSQLENFWSAVSLAEGLGLRPEVRHLANSAATIWLPQAHADLVRPGLAIYGLTPTPELPNELGLRPVMTVESRLSNLKWLPAGQGVSYGHTYVTERDTLVGLVPAGYADGIPRHAGNAGPVRVGDQLVKVAGRVCMDQFVLDLGPNHAGEAGQRVTLWGDPAQGDPSAQDWADAADTISYEIVTRLGARVPRFYSNAIVDNDLEVGAPAMEGPLDG